MTDNNAFERFVADHLADDGSGTAQAERIAASIDERTSERRQLPRWLALIKESPMRTNSHLAVGSPTVRVMVVMAMTMLLALTLAAAGAGAKQLLAADGPIIVAADGSGDFTSIQAAVDAAEDGDEILVRPGTYAEVVIIEKDIALRGDGPREEVILEFGEDGPTIPSWNGQVPYGLMLVDTEAIVSDLMVRGPNAASAFVFVGGAPTLENVVNELEGDFSGRAHVSVGVFRDAGGTIRDSLLDGPVGALDVTIPEYADITGSGRWLAEDNTLDTGFALDVTDGSVFLRNIITDDGLIELALVGSGSVLIAENDVATIELLEESDGFTIRDNVVHAPGSVDTLAGITLGTGAALVEGNVITDVPIGIIVPDGASPTITGNRLEGLRTGIGVLAAETVAVIEDNWFCGNEQDLVVQGSSHALDPSNEVCEHPTE